MVHGLCEAFWTVLGGKLSKEGGPSGSGLSELQGAFRQTCQTVLPFNQLMQALHP